MKNLFFFIFVVSVIFLTGCSGGQNHELVPVTIHEKVYSQGTDTVETYKVKKNHECMGNDCNLVKITKYLPSGEKYVVSGEETSVQEAAHLQKDAVLYTDRANLLSDNGNPSELQQVPVQKQTLTGSGFDWSSLFWLLLALLALALIIALIALVLWFFSRSSNIRHDHYHFGTRQEFVGLPTNSGSSPQLPSSTGSWNTPIGQGGRVYEREQRMIERIEYPPQGAGS